MEKLKNQPKIQNYRHNYFLVLITGLLGCKWHRYKQSTKSNTKSHLIGFAATVFSFLYISFIFYAWNALYNDLYDIKTNLTLEWEISFYILGYVLICIFFSYHAIVFILCLFHIQLGFQLFVHPLHLVIFLINASGCTAVIILLCIYHSLWWPLMLISLKVIGIFLDIGIMLAITLICYILIRQFYLTSWKVGRWVSLGLMSVVMLCLYLAPIGIDCPLVADSTPPNPGIVAIGGASYQAAEYSDVAFQKAISEKVDGIHASLQLSSDGVPFLYDRDSLIDFTNATTSFPNRSSYNPMEFTMKELHMLDIGSWFLRHDPFGNAYDLTKSDEDKLGSARILSLCEMVASLAKLRSPPTLYLLAKRISNTHSSASTPISQVIDDALSTVQQNISHIKIYYGTSENKEMVLSSSYVGDDPQTKDSAVYLRYDDASKETIRQFKARNVSVIVGPVNTEWMQSYFRFLEVDFVATQRVKQIHLYEDPLWTMTSDAYLALFITLDLASVLFIILCFVCLRIHMFGATFSPESISINTGRARQYRSRNMKEKLLREGVSTDNLDDTEMQDRGLENHPTFQVSSTSGSVLGGDSTATHVTAVSGSKNNNNSSRGLVL